MPILYKAEYQSFLFNYIIYLFEIWSHMEYGCSNVNALE